MRILYFRVLFAISALCLISTSMMAQTIDDSIALVNASWNVVKTAPGLECSKLSIRLFDTDQKISCLKIDPEKYHLELTQQKNRETVRTLSLAKNAIAGVNGGFFKTGTNEALANDFIKIDGQILPVSGGWGSAAVAIDDNGGLGFSQWIPGNETSESWHNNYNNVIVAGPMLLLDNVITVERNLDRHPRSLVGVKKDGTIVILVVDGRQKNADGMSFFELAHLSRYLGLQSSLNLDGGGSSCLWLNDFGNVNRSSDKILFLRIPRAVCNALVVIPNVD